MSTQSIALAVLIPMVAALLGRVIWGWIASSKKESTAILAQDFKNKEFERDILDLKDGWKEYKNKHDALQDDRNVTKQLLLDGINKLTSKFDLMALKMDNMFEDHSKRLDVLEKKILS